MTIAIGSDHAGFHLKGVLVRHLTGLGHDIRDLGTDSADPIDYPITIRPVAEAVGRGEVDRGIVLGGSGQGEAIVANRVPRVRCSLCWNVASARLARQHNDANVLAMGERLVAEDEAIAILDVWLTTSFEGGRHARRIALIDQQE